jgi:hypothetical protein
MSKQTQNIKRHFYRLALSDVSNDQILEALKHHDDVSFLRPSQFIRILVHLGLEEYKTQHKREAKAAAVGQGGAREENTREEPAWTGYFRGVKRDGNVLYPVHG